MKIRLLLAWSAMALSAYAQGFSIQPISVRQGDTLHVKGPKEAEAARFRGRTVRLFAQPEGGSLGLMPVGTKDIPGNQELEFLDGNGAILRTAAVTVKFTRFPSQNIAVTPAISALKPSPDEVETVRTFRQTITDTRYWKEPLLAPVSGCMTSPFGVKRLHNHKETGRYHDGLDVRAASGTPVRAVTGGTVRIARPFNIHGGTVAIDHGQGLESMYLHLSDFAVEEGSAVEPGRVIGYVGSTGRSTAPHLHWSLYVNGVAVNPRQWVRLPSCYGSRPPSRQRARVRGKAAALPPAAR